MKQMVRNFGVTPLDQALSTDGLTFLQAMIDGKLPAPPIAETLGFDLVEVAQGKAVFEGMPAFRHYNPLGTVHGGFAMTLLDSCLGCAVHTTMAKGEGYTTLEVKVNLVRAITRTQPHYRNRPPDPSRPHRRHRRRRHPRCRGQPARHGTTPA